MSLPDTLTTEIQKLEQSAIIELLELDCTPFGGDLLRFHAGTNELKQNVVWQGEEYVRFPISVTGFEYTGQGQFPRPKIRVSNVMSAITALVLQYNDLIGAKLTRRRTMAKFLDEVNFSGGNPSADPTAEFELDVYYIDRKSSENMEVVEFELSSACDLAGVRIPRRQIVQNICIWKYRGAECGFTGAPEYDENDDPINPAVLSAEAQALIDAIKVKNSALQVLSTAQSALESASQTKDQACQLQYIESVFVADYS